MDDYTSGEIIRHERKIKHNKDIVSLAIDEPQEIKPQQKEIKFFQVKNTCPFTECGLQDLQGKKWQSVEDAGILLCTKAPA